NSVIIRKKGQTCLCQFSQSFTNNVYWAEKMRLQYLLKNKDLKVVYNELEKVQTQCIILLFGSYAKETQTIHSDYDFLIISNQTQIVEKSNSWIPKKIHITSINYEVFVSMLRSKEFSIVSEAVKNNVIFYGIEDYYRFLKNA